MFLSATQTRHLCALMVAPAEPDGERVPNRA